jgi:hypothetical protein
MELLIVIIMVVYLTTDIRYGVVANIIASHAIARGSIPRVGTFCFSLYYLTSAPFFVNQ